MHTYVKKTMDFCRRNQKVMLAVVLSVIVLTAMYYMNRAPSEAFANHKEMGKKEPFSAIGDDVEYTTGPVEWDADKEVAIVFHRMPTCGPCKAFTPVWQKVAAGLRGKKDKSGRAIRTFVVDQQHQMSEDVSGFPTVRKYVSREEHHEFNGPRTEENLSSFIIGV